MGSTLDLNDLNLGERLSVADLLLLVLLGLVLDHVDLLGLALTKNCKLILNIF